jgi:hypothetical protein
VSNVTKVLEQKFDVVPKTFGLVALYTTSDMDGNLPSPPSGVIGQNLFIQCALVGFDRKDKKPNAQVELRIFDESNKPTLAKATSAAVPAEAPEGDPVLFRFLIPFNREGSFTAEVKATDLISYRGAARRTPLRCGEMSPFVRFCRLQQKILSGLESRQALQRQAGLRKSHPVP